MPAVRGTATGDRTPTGHSEEMDEESVQLIENAAAAISASAPPRHLVCSGLSASTRSADLTADADAAAPPPSRPTQVDGGELDRGSGATG